MLRLRGYVSSRSTGCGIVPQRVQNLVMRDYCQQRDFLYLLGAVEYRMAGCDLVLKDLLQNRVEVDGLLFYSVGQLPDSDETRMHLYTSLHENFQLHFALEQMAFKDFNQTKILEDILMGRALSRNSAGVIDG